MSSGCVVLPSHERSVYCARWLALGSRELTAECVCSWLGGGGPGGLSQLSVLNGVMMGTCGAREAEEILGSQGGLPKREWDLARGNMYMYRGRKRFEKGFFSVMYLEIYLHILIRHLDILQWKVCSGYPAFTLLEIEQFNSFYKPVRAKRTLGDIFIEGIGSNHHHPSTKSRVASFRVSVFEILSCLLGRRGLSSVDVMGTTYLVCTRVLLLACHSAWSVHLIHHFKYLLSASWGGLSLVLCVGCIEIITHGPCVQGIHKTVGDTDTESSSSPENS